MQINLFFTKLACIYLNIIIKCSKLKQRYLIGSVIVIDVFVSSVFSFILFPNHENPIIFTSKTEAFFLAVIFAPIVETAIFQKFMIEKLLRGKKERYFLSFFISSICFGISHYYSLAYILKAFISGMLYSTLYITIHNKKGKPFISVCFAHSIFNFIGFLFG